MSDPADIAAANKEYTVEIEQLLCRAAKGDASSLPALQNILDTYPDVWRISGNLATKVETALLALIAGKDLLVQESVRRRLTELKADLCGDDATPLEKLLGERVALEWMFLHFADEVALRTTATDELLPLSADFREKKRDFAHRRFLRSIKVLADVRRLLRPKAAPLDFSRRNDDSPATNRPLPWHVPGGRRGKGHSQSVSCAI